MTGRVSGSTDSKSLRTSRFLAWKACVSYISSRAFPHSIYKFQDAKFLEQVIGQAQSMLPALRAEYAQVMEELEKEEAAVAELEKSDKDYLSELKTSIAEQEYVFLSPCALWLTPVLAWRSKPPAQTYPKPKLSFRGCRRSI